MTENVFRIGIVGGAGPAVIADFMHKTIRHAAKRRCAVQLGMLVEQSPRIADRAENLIGAGPDLTEALHAACRKLEAAGADLIAIPCNTPFAFVRRVQPFLSVHIANMLDVVAQHVADAFPAPRQIGLLATSGTLASGVYERTFKVHDRTLAVPSLGAQSRLMEAIYGASGVKAGFLSGTCEDDLRAALEDLASRGIDVAILGCPELAMLPLRAVAAADDRVVSLIDPAAVLAQHCVAFAEQGGDRRATGRLQAGAARNDRLRGPPGPSRPDPRSDPCFFATADLAAQTFTSNSRASS